MRKLRTIIFVLIISFIAFISDSIVIKANDLHFNNVVSESFENVEDGIWEETVFWANNGDITTNTSDIITNNKSLIFNSTSSDGWIDFGGTSTSKLLIQDGIYSINVNLKATNLDYVVVKVLDEITHQPYKKIVIDPGLGKKVDDSGNELAFEIGESLSLNDNVLSLSFSFESIRDANSYLVFSGYSNDASSSLVIDDFLLEKKVKKIEYRNVEINNFDNSEGEIYRNSLFWVNDDEGTTGEYSKEEAIQNKSLIYTINKDGWDILGGTQGDKIDILGGHTYRISFDLRLIDVDYFTMKVMTISNPEKVLYEMYVNSNGQRLPGEKQLSNPESIRRNGDVISLSFTFSSDISNDSYLFLNAKSNEIGGKVVLDNVVIEEEIFQKEYITYTDYFTSDFESNELDSELIIGSDTESNIISDQGKVSGIHSLKLDTLIPFTWNEVLMTDGNNLSLENEKYKLHMKSQTVDVELVKLQLVRVSDDYVIHELYYNDSTQKRIDSFGDEYLDNGKVEKIDGVTISQFEFPQLEENVKYYVKILVFPMSDESSIYIDDFNILKEADEITPKTDLYERPQDYSKPNEYLPTGYGNLSIFPSSLDSSNLFGLIITISLGVITISFGLVILLKRLSKKFLIIFMSLLVITAIFGITIIDSSSIDKVITSDYKNIDKFNVVYPEKIDGNLDNPGMGWVALEEPTYGGHPDMGSSGDLPEVKNISLSTSWALIETKEGVYDWSLTDQIIDYYTSMGKRINLRIATDTLMLPNTYKGVPNWLMDKYNIPFEEHNYTDSGPVKTFKVVDTRDPNYRHYLGLFLEALADKYGENDYIDVVEIRGYGNWGEWHSGHSFDSDENRMNSLANIINQYRDAFEDTGKLLVLSAAWDPYFVPYESYEEYYELSALDYLMTIDNATFRRDSGGNLLNYYTDERLMSDAFRSGKRLPLLGEFASGIQNALDGSYGFDLIGGIDDIIFKMRPNYSTVLGWVNMNAAYLIEEGYGEIFDRGNDLLGYRLAVDMARYPKTISQTDDFTFMTSFSNLGVGVFWYDYDLKISFINGSGEEIYSEINTDFDARTFTLGEVTNVYSNINLPDDMENGIYKVAVSLVDKDHTPQINLGMAGEINDSKMYELGTIKVDNQADKIKDVSTKYESVSDITFKPQTTYMVTFSYTPHFDKQNFKLGNYDGYVFALTSDKGGDCATVGYTKWQDISELYGQKTVHFTTHDFNDYKLNIVSEAYGEIDIHDIFVEEVGGYLETFENYDFTDLDSIYLPIKTKYTNFSNVEDVISGKKSVTIESSRSGDTDGLKTDASVYKLENNSTYTISFKFKALTETGKGGYMYLNLQSEDETKRIGEWYERADTKVTTKTFTFNTKDFQDYEIVFGIHDGGKYAIDDIILTKHAKGVLLKGNDIVKQVNKKPDIDFGGFNILEDFEDLSFNANSFDWGKFGWGQFTINKDYVISGNSSLMGCVEPEALVNEWFEFAKSKTEVYQFEANKTYTLSFDYKVLQNPNNDGNFYLLYRSESKGIEFDKGYTSIPFVTDDQIGEVKSMVVDVTIGDASDYQLIFGMHWQGSIVIDNVLITEKN